MVNKTEKYPVKYGRDHGIKNTITNLVNNIRNMIDDNASDDELCDYIDERFLYGAWGSVMKEIDDPLFEKDIRGLIVGMWRSKGHECRRCIHYSTTNSSGSSRVYIWCDVTGECHEIENNCICKHWESKNEEENIEARITNRDW